MLDRNEILRTYDTTVKTELSIEAKIQLLDSANSAEDLTHLYAQLGIEERDAIKNRVKDAFNDADATIILTHFALIDLMLDPHKYYALMYAMAPVVYEQLRGAE